MLHILTLNINFYGEKHGAWQDRQPLIEQAISEANPDIVALQAVRLDPQVASGEDQASQLAHNLGYPHVFFEPAHSTPQGLADGTAIISRLPFSHRDSLQLTHREDVEDPNDRALLLARFDLADGPFHLFNAYFSWVPEQTADNLDEAIPYINTFPDPGLLVGDFNTPADSPLLNRLREAGWVDLWSAFHPGEPGLTFEAGDLSIRIDYAWANRKLQPQARGIHLVQNERSPSGPRLSDHLGLLVTLDLEA
jgi:endonuclease/exonuclease/phosphatase family metal-dependent hydrolase